MPEGCRLLREGGASCAFSSLSRPGLGGLGGGVIVSSVGHNSVRVPSAPRHNSVRVPTAYAHRSIHAQSILPFVFQVHAMTRSSKPKA